MKYLMSFTAALLLGGCGQTEHHVALLRPPGPPLGRAADVYVTAPPARPFYEVALVEVAAFGADADPEHVVRAMSARAGELGCDAVVRVALDAGRGALHASGVCVRYLNGASAPAPSPAPAPAPSVPSATDAGAGNGGEVM